MARKPKSKEFPPSIRWLDDAAEAHYFHESIGMADAPHQPLTGWLYLTAARMVKKKDVRKLLKERTGVDPKTLAKGPPKRISKLALMTRRLNEDLDRRYKNENQRFVMNTKRVVTVSNQVSLEFPDGNPCISFLGELGALAGDDYTLLCHGVDSLSKAMLYSGLTREQVGAGLSELPAFCGFIKNKEAVFPAKSLDPGLDAMLMLLAALDISIAKQAAVGQIWSIFQPIFGSGAASSDHPVRRLLDVFYGVTVFLKMKKNPDRRPSAEELDRTLLDPSSDTGLEDRHQRIGRWRRGEALLWREDVEEMAEWVYQVTRQDVSLLFICLYLASQFWLVLRSCVDFDQGLLVDRYLRWWHAMAPEGVSSIRSDGYWSLLA